MTARFIDQFDVLLFDLMDTLMFGGNRFGAEEDYARTYRQLGGTQLTDAQVQQVIHAAWSRMREHFSDPAYYNDFRPADHYLAEALNGYNLPHTDLARLHDVFAQHELGHVPDAICRALRQLAQTHRLGLVSNLWSGKRLFVEAFERCGIHNLFEVLVFSSDYNTIKPAPTLFRLTLDALRIAPQQALFIGNDTKRDVDGAVGVGMDAVLVGDEKHTNRAAWQVRDVTALLVG